MKRIVLSLLLIFSAAAAFSQRVGVLNGPSGIPCAYLMENTASGKNRLEFENFASAQTELPKLVKGEIDIGFLPPNAAAKIYNSSNGAVVCLGVAGNGNLFLMTRDPKIGKISDLDGKTISCAGQGATPEYMMKFLLSKNSASAELDFSTPNAEIAAALIGGKFDYALVPEPFATVAQSKDSSVVRALDISAEFRKTENSDFPMTLLVVNSKYAEKHPKEVRNFVKLYKKASGWTVKNPKDAGALAEKHSLGLKAQVAAKAIENAAFVWKESKKSRAEIERLLSIFLENAPESIGGKLPEGGFYR